MVLRVLLVDDHPLFLEGLHDLLNARGIPVVGTARDGFEALEQARALRPDVIIMDIQMPRCDGLTATRLIKAELPEVKIVMLTVSDSDSDLFEAVRSGAYGYVLKNVEPGQFFELLLNVAHGHAPFSPGLAARVLAEFARQAGAQAGCPASSLPAVRSTESSAATPALSSRQLQILSLVAEGLTYREVGEALHLSERTIKYHMGEIVRRLHVKNRAQAIAQAPRLGASGPPEADR
jgi:two-component system NarL family response regulator